MSVEASRYTLDQIKVRAEGLSPEDAETSERDMALIMHTLGRFNRGVTMTLREGMREVKRDYDLHGEDCKTPFALRRIGENPEFPMERDMVIGNINSFATTHGCSGACGFCIYVPLKTGDLEVVSLDQKTHFYDELANLAGLVDDDSSRIEAAFSHAVPYMDTDPFDDPDVVELAEYLWRKYGVSLSYSTIVPKRGEESFVHLAGLSKRYERLRNLVVAKSELTEIVANLDDSTDVRLLFGGFSALNTMRTLVGTLEGICILNEETQRIVLEANADHYNFALEVFSVGSIEDLIPVTHQTVGNIRRIIAFYEDKLEPNKAYVDAVSDFMVKYYDDISDVIMDGVEDYNLTGMLNGLTRFLEEEGADLEGEPDVGLVRVSEVDHRHKAVNRLHDMHDLRFAVGERWNEETQLKIGGEQLFDGVETGGYGISCKNGMKLTPFGLLNGVTGRMSKKFPQGRILVPYFGLMKGNVLAKSGDDLGRVLERTIVIHEKRFTSKTVPTYVHVFDGDSRIRRIEFDHDQYTVISDEVVREGVEDFSDILDLKRCWQVDS